MCVPQRGDHQIFQLKHDIHASTQGHLTVIIHASFHMNIAIYVDADWENSS